MIPTTLNCWINVATRGLCEDAKARVRAEVEGHFAAAYEAVVRDGPDEESARAHALRQLGDPDAARVRLGRTHLTTDEYRRLQSIVGPKSWFIRAFSVLWAASIVLTGKALLDPHTWDFSAFDIAPFGFCVLFGARYFLPVFIGPRLPRFTLVVTAISSLLSTLYALIWCAALIGLDSSPGFVGCAYFLALGLLYQEIWNAYPLIAKLSRRDSARHITGRR